MYIFLNSIGNTQPTTPSEVDDVSSEAPSYAAQEVGPGVILTLQLPVRSDDTSS